MLPSPCGQAYQGYKSSLISTIVDWVFDYVEDEGYRSSLISTIVDGNKRKSLYKEGYKPSLISTIVDELGKDLFRHGYKPSLISTIVDRIRQSFLTCWL